MIKLKNKMPLFAVFLISLFFCLGFTLNISFDPVSAASPPFGCPGGPIGPGNPSSCPYTEYQIQQFCSRPSTIPNGESVFCQTRTGTVEVNNQSKPPNAPITGECSDGSYVEASSPEARDRICAGRALNKTKGPAGNFGGTCEKQDLDQKNCAIIKYALLFTNILSALVGIVVVIMIAIGGLQYAASRDNPQATINAKNRLKTAVLALVGYLFIFAFLQYIIPGGIL